MFLLLILKIYFKQVFLKSSFRSIKFLNIISITNWSANSSTVFIENLLEQKLKRSSSDGPSNSITITL